MRVEVYPRHHFKRPLPPWRAFERVQWLGQAKFYTLSQAVNSQIVSEVFADPLLNETAWDGEKSFGDWDYLLQVGFKKGVTDNAAHAAQEALGLRGVRGVKVQSGKLFFIKGELSEEALLAEATPAWYNPLIHQVQIYRRSENRFDLSQASPLQDDALTPQELFEVVALPSSFSQWQTLNQERGWSFYEVDFAAISQFYQSTHTQKWRRERGLPVEPTNVELEVLAQTWSEHCKHRIFSAKISYQGEEIEGLFPTYIKGLTKELSGKLPYELVSLFSDNAGIVRFKAGVDVALKVETHNSPSALDPYGGALTGILGVNRDILGVGLGAKPIANMDVFCVAPPPNAPLPMGLKPPESILQGIHQGVKDGGNKSGIPTVNGAIYFHPHYLGKPLVYCGTLGVLPASLGEGIKSFEKRTRPGDKIVMAGGRVGKDGIHGATFSSRELQTEESASVVQIGDPLTQKRLGDFLLQARDAHLFSGVTDNGAGGLSSSIGEMAELTGGARLDLSCVLLKYPGLSPFEILISESQERMSFSVPSASLDAFLDLAQSHGVECCVLGEFNDQGRFDLWYDHQLVGSLPLDFLHEGAPVLELKAQWDPAWRPSTLPWQKASAEIFRPCREHFLKILAHPNVRSKESWVRVYDHEVQGATALKPFAGPQQLSPQNGGVIDLERHGGLPQTGVSLTNGLNPLVGERDAFLMGQMSLDEAVRNAVALGADPDQITLVDNFCWPDPLPGPHNPDAAHKLAQLVEANRALFETGRIYQTPLISGKDSMKNDYRGYWEQRPLKISAPATLLITAMSFVPRLDKLVTSYIKREGDLVALVGDRGEGLAASVFHDLFAGEFSLPPFDAHRQRDCYRSLFRCIQEDRLSSSHDISDGGLWVTVAEKMMGTGLGMELEELSIPALFSEQAGRFVISFRPEYEESLAACLPLTLLGKVIAEPQLVVGDLSFKSSELLDAWRGGV